MATPTIANSTTPPAVSPADPPFVSQQVSAAERYYLDLNPVPQEDLIVVCGGVERMRADYSINRNSFPFYGIELVAEGHGSVTLHNQRFPLSPGIVFAYGPGTPHAIHNDPLSPMRKYYVDIAGRNANRLLREAGLDQKHPLRVTALHECIALFDDLGREAREESPLSLEICKTLLKLLLLKIQQRGVIDGRELPRSLETYHRIRAYIMAHFLRLDSIESVAKECKVTSVYLSRLFHRFGSSGAYQFLLRQKMNHAAELLLEEGLLVKQVAQRVGFADAFQFSRAFKRLYGVSPRQFVDHYPRQKEVALDE